MTDCNKFAAVDDRSQRLGLPLPHPANRGLVDVMRLREALGRIDEQVVSRDDSTALRTPCTDSFTVYVRTDGNDGNDGLSPVTAKKTVAAARDALLNVDGRGHDPVIDIGAGTFESEYIDFFACHSGVDQRIHLRGAGKGVTILKSPSSYIIRADGAYLLITDMTLQGGLLALGFGLIHLQNNIALGPVLPSLNHLAVLRGGLIFINTVSCDVYGDSASFMTASSMGCGIEVATASINFVNNPKFSVAVCGCYHGANIRWSKDYTYTGTATGKRYIVDDGGMITTGSGDPDNFLPGTITGEVRNNGVIGGRAGSRLFAAGDLTLYVSTTGDDSKDGRTTGNALKTWEGVIRVLRGIDMCGYSVTVSFAPGTYGGWEKGQFFRVPFYSNIGYLRLTSQDSNNRAVLSGCVSAIDRTVARVVIGDIRIKNDVANTIVGGKNCLEVYNGGIILIEGNVSLEGGVTGLALTSGATLIFVRDGRDTNDCIGKITFSGKFNSAIHVDRGQFLANKASIHFDNVTVNSASIQSYDHSLIVLNGAVFTGAVVGKRYHVALMSIIQTSGAGANFIPGTVAGTADAATFGLYL